jgi:hypothetical protein
VKRVFISILIFYLVVHFIIPGIYFLIDGNFNTYTNVQDNAAILKGFILNAVTILGTIGVIMFLPGGRNERPIEPRFYKLTGLFYVSIIFAITSFFIGGGFEGKISGSTLGSLFNYLALFLNPFTILLFILFFQRKQFSVVVLFLIYLIYTILTGSRSGFISLFIIFLMYPLFTNYTLYRKSIRRLLISLLIISPVIFLTATILIRKADIPLSSDIIMRMIMGRMSFLETSMLPIHYKDMGDPLSIFYEKYSILNQLKLMIDALFPGNLFSPDVMPNQYYRAAFMGYSEDFVINVYTSINITLPVYLYMYFGSFFSCLISILILVFYYRLCLKCVNNIFLLVPLLASLYHLLYFFDWVMWFLQFFTFWLTTFTIFGFSLLRQAFVDVVKKTPITIQSEISS